MDERLEELFALYALGDLSDAEMQEVEAYLAQHPEAEAKLNEMLWTTAALAHAAPASAPSRQIEQMLMARVTADAQVRFPAKQTAVTRWRWWARLRALWAAPVGGRIGYALAAVALVWAVLMSARAMTLSREARIASLQVTPLQTALINLQGENATLEGNLSGLALENAELRDQLTRLAQERDTAVDIMAALSVEKSTIEERVTTLMAVNEDLQAQVTAVQQLNVSLENDLTTAAQIAALITSPQTQRIILPGTEAQPQAQGELLYDPDSQIAILFVEGMSALDPDQVYQVLLIRNDGHDTAETFAVNIHGQSALIVHAQAPLHTFTSVGVSIEPEGGSLQRTGDVILLGELIRS